MPGILSLEKDEVLYFEKDRDRSIQRQLYTSNGLQRSSTRALISAFYTLPTKHVICPPGGDGNSIGRIDMKRLSAGPAKTTG